MAGPHRQKRQNTARGPTSETQGGYDAPPRLQRGLRRGRRGGYAPARPPSSNFPPTAAPFMAPQPGQSYAQQQAAHAGHVPPFQAPVRFGYHPTPQPFTLAHAPQAFWPGQGGTQRVRPPVRLASISQPCPMPPAASTPQRGMYVDHRSAPSATLRDPAAAAILSNISGVGGGGTSPLLSPAAQATAYPLGRFPHSPPPPTPNALSQGITLAARAVSQPLMPPPARFARAPHRAVSATHAPLQRIGPPPKAILGGPGGRTFEERAGASAPVSPLCASAPSPCLATAGIATASSSSSATQGGGHAFHGIHGPTPASPAAQHPVSAPPVAPDHAARAASPVPRPRAPPHSAPLPRSPASDLSEVEDVLGLSAAVDVAEEAEPVEPEEHGVAEEVDIDGDAWDTLASTARWEDVTGTDAADADDLAAHAHTDPGSPAALARSMHTSVSGSTAYLTARASTPSPSPPPPPVLTGTSDTSTTPQRVVAQGTHWADTVRAGRSVGDVASTLDSPPDSPPNSRPDSPPATARPSLSTPDIYDNGAALFLLQGKDGREFAARRHSSPLFPTHPLPFRRTFSVADAVLKRPPRHVPSEQGVNGAEQRAASPVDGQQSVTHTAHIENAQNNGDTPRHTGDAHGANCTIATVTDGLDGGGAEGKVLAVREDGSPRHTSSHVTSLSIDTAPPQRDLPVDSYPISALTPPIETAFKSNGDVVDKGGKDTGMDDKQAPAHERNRKDTLRSSATAFTPKHQSTPSALGLFTFTHKLRPSAAEFKPQLRSVTSPTALPSASALALHLETTVDDAPFFVPPRKSAPIAIEAPRAYVRVPAPISSPWRHSASPRFGSGAGVGTAYAASETGSTRDVANQGAPDDDGGDNVGVQRSAPRRGRHTAKRSSQNSYLPRAWVEREISQPPTPTVSSLNETVHIERSRPLRLDAQGGHMPRVSSDSAMLLALRGALTRQTTTASTPCTADTFSPIAALPSELDLARDGTLPSASLKDGFAGVEPGLNPKAEPFVLPTDHPEVHLNGTPHGDAPEGLCDRKFRHWVFPTDTPSPRVHKRRYSDAVDEEGGEGDEVVQWSEWPNTTLDVSGEDFSLSTQTSVEFPLRPTPPRHLSVVNSTPTPEAARVARSPPSHSALVPGRMLADLLAAVKGVGAQVKQLHAAHDTLLEDSERRARDAVAQGTLAADTLNIIKDYFASAPSFDTVARTLEAHTEILHDIQHRIEEETRTSAPVSPVRAERQTTDGDTSPSLPDMFRAMLSDQHAIMAKFGEYSEAQDIVYDLRSATDALLEAQGEFRQAKVDVRNGHEIVRLQDELRALAARAARAESESTALRARLEAVQADEHAKIDLTTATATLARVAAAEEQSSAVFDGMCARLEAQNASHHAAVEDIVKRREAAASRDEERVDEARSLHAASLAWHKEAMARLRDVLDSTALEAEKQRIEAERDAAVAREAVLKERVVSLERDVADLRIDLAAVETERRDLRVQLAEARSEVQLAAEKALRVADAEAGAKRTLELQIKADKARATYLETKAARAEAATAAVAGDLDAWRSAALEQRLRAEQATTRIAALQQENFHWREFALGADRHRLEQWLATRPFVGVDAAERESAESAAEPATPRARPVDANATTGCPTPRPTPPSSATLQPKHP